MKILHYAPTILTILPINLSHMASSIVFAVK